MDFVFLGNFRSSCSLLHGAIDTTFNKCGKKIQHTYKNDKNEKSVKSARIKKWLEHIRQEARSK